MTAHDVSSLIDWLRRQELLGAEQLAEAAGALQARLSEAGLLLEELVFRGWLTPYQAAQFRDGGRVRLGRYVLLECLGRGGQGEVFKALDRTMNRLVALKILRGGFVSAPEAFRRFQREVRVLADLSHPNLVVAHHAELTGEVPFLVMEYAAGVSLANLVAERGPLPQSAACELVRQAAVGLQHVHERGFVHRDVKPSNLLLVGAGRGVVKVLDLGLARSAAASGESLSGSVTDPGAVMGTPDYMAPEQALDARSADARADVYGLGCTLYHLLTGRPPYPRGSAFEKLLQHRESEPTPVESLRPDVPLPLAAVVRRMMARRREDRYQTAADVARALEPFCRLDESSAHWAGGELWDAGSLVETVGSGQGQTTTAQPDGRTRRSGRPLVLAACLLLPVLGLLAWWWWPTPSVSPVQQPTTVVSAAGGGDFRSINEAIKNVRPGTRILIRPGTYRESVVLDKEVHLVGEGPVAAILLEAVDTSVLVMQTDRASVRGLTIHCRVRQRGKKAFFAVKIPEGRLKLEDCDIRSDAFSCVAIYGPTTNPTLHNCRIHHAEQAGVFLYEKAHARLIDCNIHSNGYAGVMITEKADPYISNCTIAANLKFGVFVYQEGGGRLDGCTIARNAMPGVYVREGGKPFLRQCDIEDGQGPGVHIAKQGDGTLESCKIRRNAQGGVVIEEGHLVLQRCTLSGNKAEAGVIAMNQGVGVIEDCTFSNNAGGPWRQDAGSKLEKRGKNTF